MRKALVVGFDNYPKAPLTGCINDAHKMDAALSRNADGSPNFGVKLLTDSNGLVTKGELNREIHSLFQDESDTALFYFSGHGTLTATGGTIVTPDYVSYDEGVSMDQILNLANGSRAKDKIIILDCCYSGQFANLGNASVTTITDGVSILTSSRSYQTSVENNGTGLFTSLVLEALYGGASDLRGNVTPGSIYSFVDNTLGEWDQRPVFKTNVSRFTSLRKVTPPIPIEILRKLSDFFETPESHFELNPTYEFTEPSAVEDNVSKFKILQKLESVGLVVPCDEDHMYFAAINSKACRLTTIGNHYWHLANEGRL